MDPDNVDHETFARGWQTTSSVQWHSEVLCETGAERLHVNDGQTVPLLFDV